MAARVPNGAVERGVEGAGPQPAPVRGERLDLAHHAIPVQGSGRERGEDEKRGFLYGHPGNVPTIGISRQSVECAHAE